MTLELLNKIIQANNIPPNVKLMSDSGWECCATDMDGIWYNAEENIIVFTQRPQSYDKDYFNNTKWKYIYGEPADYDEDFIKKYKEALLYD